MPLQIVDPTSTELEHVTSVDVKFSGVHIGGGIYFSANHVPTPGGTSTAEPQSSLDTEAELHNTTEIDYTLPSDSSTWDDYFEDIDGNGSLDYVLTGFDMSMHVGDALASTGTFYDGPAAPMLIANDPNDLVGSTSL